MLGSIVVPFGFGRRRKTPQKAGGFWLLDNIRQPSYTKSMKTAISLPDTVFLEAERFARHVKKSRSKLYAEALSEYLCRHSPDEITESLNQVAAKINSNDLQFVKHAARKLVAREAW
jgi:predicted transcriptional regulator